MVVGGSFTTVTPTAGAGAGTAVTRKYLFAFNATTGALDTGFVPSVNGEVDSIVPTADGTGVYVGGMFTTAGGVSTRLAEFNLTTGARVATFNPSLNGQINDMALSATGCSSPAPSPSVKSASSRRPGVGQRHHRRLDPYLSINLTGHHNYGRVAGAAEAASAPPSIAVSPDGTRAIVDGNFIQAQDGVGDATRATRSSSIILGAELGHGRPELEHERLHQRLLFAAPTTRYVRDIGWSPDGSYFVVAATGGYYGSTFQDCDAASRFNASSTGQTVHAGLDRLDRHRLAVLGRRHLVGGLRRRPPALAEQPVRPGQRQAAGAVPRRASPRSTRPTACRCRGTRDVTRAATAPRWSTRPPRASGSAATPTTSATTSTSARSWRSSPSPAERAATGDNTGDPHTVFLAGASGKLLHCQQLSTPRPAPAAPTRARAAAAGSPGAASPAPSC